MARSWTRLGFKIYCISHRVSCEGQSHRTVASDSLSGRFQFLHGSSSSLTSVGQLYSLQAYKLDQEGYARMEGDNSFSLTLKEISIAQSLQNVSFVS